MSILLDLLYTLAVVVGWPFLIVRRLRRGPGSLAIRERMGGVPSRTVSARSVWLHAVSVGEVNATRTLVAELHQRAPDAVVAISSTTQTGLARARQLYPDRIVFRFPLDFSFVIHRVLARIRPSVIVLMELETWPNLLEIARRRRIPVLIANGRITQDRSVRRFERPGVRWLARRMFSSITWVGAQDRTYAERFARLGVPVERVEVVGSLKYDAADVADVVPGQQELAAEMAIDTARPLWVCGSTGPGEEAIVLDAYQRLGRCLPNLQLAIIPRKPERFDDVAQLIVARGLTCLRRSGAPPLVPPDVPEPRCVFLGDTMGELRRFYALATVVFVGRSLVPMGGSDMMEAAALARPLLVGPHTENFTEPVRVLVDAGGCNVVHNGQELERAVARLVEDGGVRESMAQAARETIIANRGAAARSVRHILDLMD